MNHRIPRMLLIVAIGLATTVWGIAGAQADEAAREWTDSTGAHRVLATLEQVEGLTVHLRKSDGMVIQLPVNRLSTADQAYVRAYVRARRASKDQPGDRVPAAQGAELTSATNDWPQWRGPRRDGISNETGLMQQWPAEGPPVAWQMSGLGSGFSSVAIAGGKIYTLGKFGGETKLVALKLTDGSPLWSTVVGGGDAPNGTPTVDGQRVYTVTHGGDLACVDAETGEVRWRKNFTSDFGGKTMSSWGFSESPLVDGDRLIVTPGGNQAMLAALDKETGATIWTSAMPSQNYPAGLDGAGYSSVVICEVGGVKQYVQLVGRGLLSVRADDGTYLWLYNRIANKTANIPTPLVDGNLICCSSGYDDGGAALLRVDARNGRVSANEVWYKTNRELQNHHGGMILREGKVYMGHGHNNGFPVCFDLKTGQDHWRPGRGPGRESAAVAYADGHLYFRYQDGTMALIEATPQRYNLKGAFKIAINNGNSWAHPVIHDGKLYLRDQHELIVYAIR